MSGIVTKRQQTVFMITQRNVNPGMWQMVILGQTELSEEYQQLALKGFVSLTLYLQCNFQEI